MRRAPAITFALVILAAAGPARAIPFSQIIQEPSNVVNISTSAATLTARLETEVGKIIAAGHLMPFRAQYGEGSNSGGYTPHENVYTEPWMMLYTLARAYPYVSPTAQNQIQTYVHSEIGVAAPWGTNSLGPTGAYRQPDPAGVPETGLPKSYERRGTMLYALWLYGKVTGNWSDIQPQWNTLKTAYTSIKGSQHTYELISGAIAMSRMAAQFNDASAKTTYDADAATLMNEGLAFDTYRANAHTDYSGQATWFRGTAGLAYPLYYLTPEVARYITDNTALKNSVVGYVETLPTSQGGTNGATNLPSPIYVWPLWWMAEAPVGDEGYYGESCAAGPDQRMMLFNYFAWIKNDTADTVASHVDVPDALIGDAYYMQNLVTAIEAYGTRIWGTTNSTPPASPKNLRLR